MLDLDLALNQLGTFGRFQCLVYCLVALLALPCGWHMLAMTIIGAEPNHHCIISQNISAFILNVSETQEEMKPDKCRIYTNITMNDSSLILCPNGWWYDNYYGKTIVSEWDLVCEKNFLVELSSSVFMVGVMVGGVIFSDLSDRFGRKKIILTCIIFLMFFGSFLVLSPNYYVFILLRFFIGCFQQGVSLVSITLSTEILHPDIRHWAVFLGSIVWASSIASLSLLGYVIKDWKYLELTISLPLMLFLIYFKFLPESLHWQVAHGQEEAALKTLKLSAKMNKITFNEGIFKCPSYSIDSYNRSPNEISRLNLVEQNKSETITGKFTDLVFNTSSSHLPETSQTESPKKYNAFDIFKTSYLRFHALIIFYFWFISSLLYYGLSLSTSTLAGDPFLNLALTGIVEIPACIIPVILLKYLGRKKSQMITFIVAGLPLFVIPFIPKVTDAGTDIRWVITTLAMIGKFGITAAWQVLLIYCAEIYPTVVRGVGVGISAFWSRIAGIIAPFTSYMNKQVPMIPPLTFGSLALVGAFLVIFLPETSNKSLPEFMEDYPKLFEKPEDQVRHNKKQMTDSLDNHELY